MLSSWAIFGIVFAVLAVIGAIVAVLVVFVFKKKEAKSGSGTGTGTGTPTPAETLEKNKKQQWTLGDNWLVQQTEMGADTANVQGVEFWVRATKTDPFRKKFSVARSGVTPHVNLFAQANEVPGSDEFAVENIVGLKPQVLASKPADDMKRTDVPALKSGAWMMSPNSAGNLVITRGGGALIEFKKDGATIIVMAKSTAGTNNQHVLWCTRGPNCGTALGSGFSTDFTTAVPAGFMEVKNETLFLNRRFAVGKTGAFYVIQGDMSTSLASTRENNEELHNVAYSSIVPSNVTVPTSQKW
jgi:hypothetical protein